MPGGHALAGEDRPTHRARTGAPRGLTAPARHLRQHSGPLVLSSWRLRHLEHRCLGETLLRRLCGPYRGAGLPACQKGRRRVNDLVTVTVDGRELQVAKGTLLWEACKANGIEIPIFCYHTKLGPVGACRTCMVEQIGGPPKPITACSTPVVDGMQIRTRSPIVEKAQRGIFEFLLANHPLDCPICDRAGECPLQDQTFDFGPGTSRYIEPKRHHVKPIALGPTIALDRERCVLCWRCVRFCAEIAEDRSIEIGRAHV